MKTQSYFWNIVFGFIFLFFLLFLFRLFYGFESVPSSTLMGFNDLVGTSNGTSLFESGRFNIASKTYKVKGKGQSGETISVDQKYEKIATLQALTEQFESDEQKLRRLIEEKDAIIQFEQKKGTKGNQSANFQIGVQPELFDVFLIAVENIGTISRKDVSKKDKTNEYRELNAKKESLEKTRQSLINLKGKGGKIAEFVELENRILQIENELQALGVSLGNYDKENEFCTVKYALKETVMQRVGILQRVKVALEWTVKIYLQLVFAFILVLGIGTLGIRIYDRFFQPSN